MSKPIGENFSLADIEAALEEHKPAILFLVQGESSTGVVQPLEGVGSLCSRYDNGRIDSRSDRKFNLPIVNTIGTAAFWSSIRSRRWAVSPSSWTAGRWTWCTRDRRKFWELRPALRPSRSALVPCKLRALNLGRMNCVTGPFIHRFDDSDVIEGHFPHPARPALRSPCQNRYQPPLRHLFFCILTLFFFSFF